MPYDINIEDVAIRTNIAADKIRESIKTYAVMAKLFPLLETKGLNVGLYGGTALNKVYFGKHQRLSYDLDIYCYDYAKTMRLLEGINAKRLESPVPGRLKPSRYLMEDIQLDISDAKGVLEKPEKHEATDILTYFNYLIPPVVVPTYSLEYLLANKTFAMAARNELKDIYDTWFGLKILKDYRKYNTFLNRIGKQNQIEDTKHYLSHQIDGIILKNIDYYKNKKIDVLEQKPAGLMIRDIKDALSL